MTATETNYERRERIGATVRAMGPAERVWEAVAHVARWLWLLVTGRTRVHVIRWREGGKARSKFLLWRTDEPDCHCCAIGRPDLCIPRARKNRKDPA